MMRTAFSAVLVLAILCALVVGAYAQGKEVTLKGTLLCAKCELKEAKQCQNAIRVKEDGKDVVYYLEDKGAKEKYHKDICMEPKQATVVGTVSEKDGKKIVTPKKVEVGKS